jgi:hypothetical protein
VGQRSRSANQNGCGYFSLQGEPVMAKGNNAKKKETKKPKKGAKKVDDKKKKK